MSYYAQVIPHPLKPDELMFELLYKDETGQGPLQPHHIRVPDHLSVKHDANFLKPVRDAVTGDIIIVDRQAYESQGTENPTEAPAEAPAEETIEAPAEAP